MDTKHDVTPRGIARRKARNKVIDVMEQLVNNNICFYTDIEGAYNDNYLRTYDILIKAFASD